MRNLKKFLALVLAFMMAMSLMVTVNASSFEDDDEITTAYSEAVDVLTELGVVNGYKQADGTTTFDPKATITRAEVAAIIYRLVTGDVDDNNIHLYENSGYFSDVLADKWYNGYVNYCANNGLVQGVGNNRFAPSDNVTGYEALVMILRAMGYNNPAEFSSSDWKLKASGYGSKLGITRNIASGSLGAAATREMVAEIMFQAIQAPMVNYSPLTLYTTDLLVDASAVNTDPDDPIYAADVPNTLMFQTFGIVGKRTILVYDGFGRPYVEWVKDDSSDTVANGGRYIPNVQNPTTEAVTPPDTLTGATYDQKEDAVVSLAMTPVHVYDNAIDECHMTKDINNDKSIYWGAITEYVNGEKLDARDNASGFIKLDELHTTTKWIGATGRTTEIYKLDDKVNVLKATGAATTDPFNSATMESVNKWIFVYVDTFLGEVTSTTDAVKDTVGHTIIEASATVSVGNNIANMTGASNDSKNDANGNETKDKYPAALTLKNPDGKYKVGDLVLIQTSNGGETAFVNTDRSANDGGNKIPDAVKVPEKAPLCPTDVPNTLAKFLLNADNVHGSILLDKSAETVKNVTIKATVGQQDAKMGIITSDGTTYYASNTFLAARQKLANGGDKVNNTVLAKWYDVPNGDQTNDNATGKTPNIGIVNGMIGRTYDIVLDHHGYIIGMKEVVNVADGVGVITGIDAVRVGSGKYVSEVEAYMTDGTTKTFQLLGRNATDEAAHKKLDKMTDGDYVYFATLSAAEAAWGSNGLYEKPDTDATGTILSIGSLVQFKSISYDGQTFYKIVDWDKTADSSQKTTEGTTATGSENLNVTAGIVDFKTGQTGTLVASPLDNRILDDKSVIFVAEYEYRYNTSGNNDGSNINKTYKVYEGFKNVPTIKGDEHNILYQQLGGNVTGNEKYVLVYAANSADAYIIKDQDKINVDESYLVLSRGATYAEYSEYNVLKNGEKTTIQVSNANKSLNAFIESTMDATVTDANSTNHLNELLVVTGRNAKGYVTSVSTVTDLVTANNSDAKANTGNLTAKEIIAGSTDVSYKNGVLKTAAAGQYLTLDDNVKVQLINRDQQTVTEISMDTAMVYATGKKAELGAKKMVFELNELGYVCNLYVIE